MTKGQAPVPFTTGPEEVAGYVMKGTGDQRPGHLESSDHALRLRHAAPSPQAPLAKVADH